MQLLLLKARPLTLRVLSQPAHTRRRSSAASDVYKRLLLKYVTQEADEAGMVMAESALAECYMDGNGVDADTVQAALWCQRAADGR